MVSMRIFDLTDGHHVLESNPEESIEMFVNRLSKRAKKTTQELVLLCQRIILLAVEVGVVGRALMTETNDFVKQVAIHYVMILQKEMEKQYELCYLLFQQAIRLQVTEAIIRTRCQSLTNADTLIFPT